MTRKVAFCVVSWNNASVLGECLDSLLAQTGVTCDIYLIDNGSTDDTRALLARYPTVHVTWSDVNNGFARGNNILIQQALRDPDVYYIALVNSDAVLGTNWATTLVDFAEQRTHVGALQGLTLDYFDHSRVDSQHIFVNGRLQGQQFGYGDTALPANQYYPRKVFGVNAAACIYTRAMIEALPDRQHGFFDERFFMFYEDVDVSFRSLICGWDSWFVPSAIAYHMGSVSAKKRSSDYSPRMVARNLPAMIYKNAPWQMIVSCFGAACQGMLLWLRDIARMHGWRAAARTATSLVQGLGRLPAYQLSRRRIQSARVIGANYLQHIVNSDGILG